MAMIPNGPPMPPQGPAMGGGPPQANPEALAAELMQVMQRAEQILAQLEAMGVDPAQLMGGPAQAQPQGALPGMDEIAATGGMQAPAGLIA